MDITELSPALGNGFSLYAVVQNNSCMVREFIENLVDSDKTQVLRLFKSVLCAGIPHNETKFRDLEGGIYELKTRSGVRILCFFGGTFLPRSLVLTHGFQKPKKKVLVRERGKALAFHEEYKKNRPRIVDV